MDAFEAIRGRRSIRAYRSEAVSRETLGRIIEAATCAPSAMNGQQWRFTVLTGGSKRGFTDFFRAALVKRGEEKGAGIVAGPLRSCSVMEQAPVVVIVWNAGEGGWEVESQSVAASIENMLLAAYASGLGGLWIADIHYANHAVREYFSSRWRLAAAVTLGYPAASEAEKKPPRKMGVSEVAEFRE